jgi:uncharacterized membrane protein
MEKSSTIRHPVEWTAARLQAAASRSRSTLPVPVAGPIPTPRHITADDLRAALADGAADFLAFRSDVIVLCFIYPIAGAVLWRFATGANMLQLVFPLAAGFALVGPLFATGLYEMSRQRERGAAITWSAAFDAFRSPAVGAIIGLGMVLMAIFAFWLFTAQIIFRATVAAEHPASAAAFAHDVLLTGPGIAMTVIGCGVGFLFAALVLCISLISFPLLLDRHTGVDQAVSASIAAARANPRVVAVWGLIVAAGLVLGAIPFLAGLIVTMPILGHATWHLYRRLMPAM